MDKRSEQMGVEFVDALGAKVIPESTLEWIGPPNQEWHDGEKDLTLVAGRRYQVEEGLARYLVESCTTHWKRPDVPKAAIATKE